MRKLRYWIPPFFIATFIFLLSSQPRITITQKTLIDFIIFKSLHMVEYAVFFIVNYRATRQTLTCNQYKAGKLALLITVLYALSDEIHQTFVPTREGKLRDVGFDALGAILALFYLWNLLPKAPKRLLILAKKLEFI